MTNGKKLSRVFGYSMPKSLFKRYVSLVEMTAGRFGLHKRYFKAEDTLWTAVEFISGMRRGDGEGFIDAVIRIHGIIGAHTIEWRNEMIAKTDRRALYQAVGMKLHESVAFEQMEENAKALDLIRAKWRAKKTEKPNYVRRPERNRSPTVAAKDEFYKSWEWRTLRMEVLKEHGRACQCCGAQPGMTNAAGEPVRICVDHIKPLSIFWNLRLEKSNLQVLCDECNQGKGNWDQTDFRPPPAPDEWLTEEDEIDPAILEQLADHTGRLQ